MSAIIGGTVALLAFIGLARVIKIGAGVTRRMLARAGRALAHLDRDAWIDEVARRNGSDTIVAPPIALARKGRK